MKSGVTEQGNVENTHDDRIHISLGDVVKSFGAFAVIIPLILGYMEYRQSVQDIQNKNFREIVNGLSSVQKQSRIASASNLGTFIDVKDPYYDDAVDILINMVAIESEGDVLNAIRSSLEKIAPQDVKHVVQKLLKLERNFFIYNSYIEHQLKAQNKAVEQVFGQYQEIAERMTSEPSGSAGARLQMELVKKRYREETLRLDSIERINREKRFKSELVANFIVSFLSLALKTPIEGLELYQNTWNYVVLSDLKLPKIHIRRSAVSSATMAGVDFSNSIIENSTFSYSTILNSDFSQSTIKASVFKKIKSRNVSFQNAVFDDVYFKGADLQGADFSGARGLKPVYFYQAVNLDRARFDRSFRVELKGLDQMTDQAFKHHVENSTLPSWKQDELL